MTCLSFVFLTKPSWKTSLKINSEMTWLSLLFHYKSVMKFAIKITWLNLNFTIKLVYRYTFTQFKQVLQLMISNDKVINKSIYFCQGLYHHEKNTLTRYFLKPYQIDCMKPSRTWLSYTLQKAHISISEASVIYWNICGKSSNRKVS